MHYEIEQCLRFEVKPIIELTSLDIWNGQQPKAAGSVSLLHADKASLELRLSIIRRALSDLLVRGDLHRDKPRDIDIGGLIVLKNCTQILQITELTNDIEIRYLQVIGNER